MPLVVHAGRSIVPVRACVFLIHSPPLPLTTAHPHHFFFFYHRSEAFHIASSTNGRHIEGSQRTKRTPRCFPTLFQPSSLFKPLLPGSPPMMDRGAASWQAQYSLAFMQLASESRDLRTNDGHAGVIEKDGRNWVPSIALQSMLLLLYFIFIFLVDRHRVTEDPRHRLLYPFSVMDL
ncbi:hypothetical protein IE53DRAFT_116756 [Violaceomyces palustris]|uniref:Uncharacterized protein n=1 Tax=Violaceomyces palustris TaxID=1673888 RepID=A0ACD0P8N7_9BASI|nr:hypothetical protein IE53DRAFT_116756 [Violaceomyces palustris]